MGFVVQVFIPKAFPFYLIEYLGTFESRRLHEFAESKQIAGWQLNPLPHMFTLIGWLFCKKGGILFVEWFRLGIQETNAKEYGLQDKKNLLFFSGRHGGVASFLGIRFVGIFKKRIFGRSSEY